MKVAALIDDLFFQSKVRTAAQVLGTELIFCHSAEEVPPDAARICVDLNATTFDGVAEIVKLRAMHQAPITAFLSHVQVALKERARNAGANEVIPRSVFVERLPEILME